MHDPHFYTCTLVYVCFFLLFFLPSARVCFSFVSAVCAVAALVRLLLPSVLLEPLQLISLLGQGGLQVQVASIVGQLEGAVIGLQRAEDTVSMFARTAQPSCARPIRILLLVPACS